MPMNYIIQIYYILTTLAFSLVILTSCGSNGKTPPSPHNFTQSNSNLQVGAPRPFLPTTFYKVEENSLKYQYYWNQNRLNALGQPEVTTADRTQVYPIAASPEHGSQPFAVPGSRHQYIALHDGNQIVQMEFRLPPQSASMKPTVDTMLMCLGLKTLFETESLYFTHAIDVGAGSGFIAKYIAESLPNAQVTAIDIDPAAISFMQSAGAGLPPRVHPILGDALQHLSTHNEYQLIVSNPPYVPTEEEALSPNPVPITNPNFWKGTGLMSYMIETSLENLPAHGHLVMITPSTALKSVRLQQLLKQLPARGFHSRILHQQEIAYKAWFAGDNRVEHLKATSTEALSPLPFGELSLFVGITNPGHPRNPLIDDGRQNHPGYHWQMVYVLDFFR